MRFSMILVRPRIESRALTRGLLSVAALAAVAGEHPLSPEESGVAVALHLAAGLVVAGSGMAVIALLRRSRR